MRDRVEFSLLAGQAGEVDFVAELAAKQLLGQNVGVIEHRMNDRDLRLVIELREAVIVNRADIKIAAFARSTEIELRHALGGKAGLEWIERTGKLPQLVIV